MKKFLSIVPRWFPAFLMMAVIFAFSAQPDDVLPSFQSWDFSIKKMGHMIGYGLLALSYFYFLKYNKKQYWLAWLMTLAYAATDEFHQSFVPGRGPSVFDVLVFDGLGALIALWLYSRFWGKQKVDISV
ncbi:MAG: VanZ family protein [Anaerolineales bacterium]|nr:VanZ family protein [Anaerolineales bacterium]